MKKFLIVLLFTAVSVSAFSQNVIKFLGIPIEGTKKEMISKLQAKGYEYNSAADVLLGEFNGNNVAIGIQTVNNRVWRIAVVDDKMNTDETNIKIRFNRLFEQLSNNSKYELLDGSTLSDSEDISYEMSVHKKRYDATFTLKDKSIHGAVWYMIEREYGNYGIIMFYENLDNAANGDDL